MTPINNNSQQYNAPQGTFDSHLPVNKVDKQVLQQSDPELEFYSKLFQNGRFMTPKAPEETSDAQPPVIKTDNNSYAERLKRTAKEMLKNDTVDRALRFGIYCALAGGLYYTFRCSPLFNDSSALYNSSPEARNVVKTFFIIPGMPILFL